MIFGMPFDWFDDTDGAVMQQGGRLSFWKCNLLRRCPAASAFESQAFVEVVRQADPDVGEHDPRFIAAVTSSHAIKHASDIR